MPELPADYVEARRRLDADHRAGRCSRCGLPLTLGQRGAHYVCRAVEAVDQAEADYLEWARAGGLDPDQPPLFVVDVDTGGRL